MHPVRLIARALELLLSAPILLVRLIGGGIVFNPRIGPLRHIVTAGVAYVVFAFALVYVIAPLRGIVGQQTMGHKLRYDAERWLATAVYDSTGAFVGTFDPRLDSRRDVNFTGAPIEVGDYTANPDHKSIPVREVPEQYWQCLVFHEDRYLGRALNPFGIDLYGVLKIPYSTIKRSIAAMRPSIGVGGSTLPMQFARVIYNTPPSTNEGSGEKLARKMREWWLAPVIYRELTKGGDITPLKQWAANHIWLAQRTGGEPLHGVEVTSRIVFGREASKLSIAEQFVLASAVNKPIILLPGDDRLNAVRLDRWKYITEVRAQSCAQRLIADETERKRVMFELVQMASGPPDPRVKASLQATLEQYAPAHAKRAQANPIIRANVLLPEPRFGLREEMKDLFGFGWREHVRGVTTSLDVSENLAFRERMRGELAKLNAKEQGRINPGFTLDPAKAGQAARLPHIVVVAANAKGEIIRYYEAGESAPYFGSAYARSTENGHYEPAREGRHIASTGKIVAAITIANEGRDQPGTAYADPNMGGNGETCEKGGVAGQRRAVVAFACSLNAPLIARAAGLGQDRVKRVIDSFGFAQPPVDANGERTPPSTASVLGLISGSPRRVHHMAGVVLGALTGQGHKAVRAPSLVKSYDYTHSGAALIAQTAERESIVPNKVIKPEGHAMLKSLLTAPLCHRVGGQAHGTLRGLAQWCADGRSDVKLHFAKTGTSTTADPDATVDTWTTGGIQFANGAAYSYVAMVGTGTARDTWGRKLHASQINVPLVEALLLDLKEHAKKQPVAAAAMTPAISVATTPKAKAPADANWKEQILTQR